MKKLTKGVSNMIAKAALNTAKKASDQFSIIFYQDEVPQKVKDLKNMK